MMCVYRIRFSSGNFKKWGDSKNRRQQDYLDAYNSAYGTNLSANEFGKIWDDQVSGLNLMRFALHDAADLSIPDQAKYFAKLDSEPFPKTAEEMRIDIIHDPILEPVQIAALQETSVQTEPVQTEPVGTNGEQNSSETLIVMPQLTPEESEVSPSQLANLNENIIAINKEGDEIHAKNADVRAASETQELININNTLSADQTISDRYIEFEKNISDQLKVDPNDDSATATAKRFIAAQLALTRGAALFVGETVTSVADLATETGKYVGQSYLAIADALVGEALSRQYPFVQSAVQDKIQTDAKIDAALSNGATAVYNFVSDAGLHMLDTAFFHSLSESSQTFRDANANLYARETKVVNWATNYFSNTGNAYASANFVDLSKNAKDVIDIATSVTGIGAINKVNNAKKAAEAAHKLENIVADMKRLDDLSLLDPARAVVFVKEMPSPLSFNQNIQPLLKEVNLTMDEFQALKLSRIEDITDIQAEKIKFIRDQVPLITSETPLYKVIPAENIPKIMSGKYDSKVGGYIAKAEDVKHIKSYGEILESIRLDYKGTPFTENLNTYGLIKFKSTISAKIEIPYGERLGGTITDASPATKNGFLASRNGEVIPEWYSPKEFPQDGAELYRVTNGVAELIGRYIKEAGTKNGRYYSIGEQK